MQLSELEWAYVQERATYFTGRGWVFARLDQFLNGPPGVFLLLGEPGAGKTAVAAQLALAGAGRLTPAAAGAAPRRAVPVAAAYFCRAGGVDLLDVAQRLSTSSSRQSQGLHTRVRPPCYLRSRCETSRSTPATLLPAGRRLESTLI
jgi:hypothetical protein